MLKRKDLAELASTDVTLNPEPSTPMPKPYLEDHGT